VRCAGGRQGDMRERFAQIAHFLLSLQLVDLDELQGTELDRALSKQRSASVPTAKNEPSSGRRHVRRTCRGRP
jgi:hypothetical protein